MWKTRSKKNIAMASLAVALFSLLLCHCKPLITFEYLDITCSIREKEEYYADEYISIHFSCMPDKNDVERKIRFYEDGSVISVDYNWDGSTVSVSPHLPWQKGQHYSLDLQGALKMEDERTYTARLYRSFIYGERGNSFELVSNEFNGNALTLLFSKPVLITSFGEKFNLTPFTEYRTDFSGDGSTVIINPKNRWLANTTYSWTVKNIISSDGYLMKKEYSGILRGIIDTEQPVLELICPVDYNNSGSLWYASFELDNHLMENQAIGFSFSKPMDEASVVAGISFFPSISGYFVKETESRFIFIPASNYQIRKEYRITIADTIKDNSGLALYEPKYLYFTTANQFLQVAKITFDDNIAPMPSDGTISNYLMMQPALPTDPVHLKTVINFSTVIPPDKRYGAVNAVSLNVLFPASANNPMPISAYWSDGGSRLSIEWSGFSVSSGDIKNHYILTVSGGQNGVKNQANEYMEADVCVIFIAL
jgi:hypothetical protein